MKLLFSLVLILVICAPVAYAQEVLVRKDDFHTELLLEIPPDEIVSVTRGGPLSVVVTFKKDIKTPFNRKLDDLFVDNVSGSGRQFVINFKPASDYAVFNDAEGLRFVATHPKEQDDVLMSYGVGAPMLRKENRFAEDPALDAVFRETDALARTNQTQQAIDKLQTMIATTRNSFYKQEALFRLGNMYMKLGEADSNAYIDASNTFDQFIITYPESNRLAQVQQLSALAKERAGQNAEAASAYTAVYNTATDAETKRMALERMGDLYVRMEQPDKAIDAYERYLANFKTDSDRIRGILGGLYLSRGMQDKAYDLFGNIPAALLTDTLSPANLLAMAQIFEDREEPDKALPLYAQIISDNVTETPEALYRVGQIRKANGDIEGYSKVLSDLGKNYPGTEYGLTALVEYAELRYAEKSAAEWKEELAPVYIGEDLYELVPRAQLVQIKALYKDNDTVRLVRMIDDYAASYPESPNLPYLAKIKEDALYTAAVSAQADKNYSTALTYYGQLLDEFSESAKHAQIVQSIDDIHFDRAKQLFDEKRFPECRTAVEDRMMEPPSPLQPRWMDLWDDTVYQNILTNVGVMPGNAIRYKSREYLTFMPNGKHVNQVKQILAEAFNYPFTQAFETGRDAEVITLYEENQGWLDTWFDQELTNSARVMVTTSLMHMNMRGRAADLFKSITPMMTPEYAALGLGLCEKNVIYDINKFTPDEFLSLIDETGLCNDPDYSLSLIKQYTKDLRTAMQAQYKLLKNIPDDRKREMVLNDTYSILSENQAARFPGYEEVYLDAGVVSFRKNDYQGAIMPLKRYVDAAGDNNSTEKKAEALYYLGKSLIALNERDRAFEYYRQLTDTIPDSIFAGMAKSEMEDTAWRNNLNNR